MKYINKYVGGYNLILIFFFKGLNRIMITINNSKILLTFFKNTYLLNSINT